MSILEGLSGSVRKAREARRIRDVLMNRAEMSDAIVKVFDLWKGGVLIMDEVDVLLHPLRASSISP